MPTPVPSPTIRLRPITPADLPLIYQQQLDPESNRIAVSNPRTPEAFAAHWAKVLDNPTLTTRAILADEVFVGTIGCFKLDGLDAVGYWLDRAHWGKGIATRALALLLAEVPTRPLHARAAATNIASIRVLQRNGFVITGHHLAPATDRFPACKEALLTLT